MKNYIFILLAIIGFACEQKTRKTEEQAQVKIKPIKEEKITKADTTVNLYKNAQFSVETFPSENGFGYDIKIDGKLMIHQANIPAVAGNQAFKTKEKALKTAELMIKKLQENQMPPSITREELEKLDVLD
ncbi:MAG: DUF4907 domain-containing protein [Microscillaceae bacterium]|jgi:hypothetical protein|nr:DUF4907 domain-containing protein [Microscillaceae bacterium]